MYLSNRDKNYKGYLYKIMSINIPLFFQNHCECVSKHYKSSKLSSRYKMNQKTNRERRMSWPMPQRAWANFENCNQLLPLPHACFVYCLCTILPSYCWIDHHMQFQWTVEINAKWIFAINLIPNEIKYLCIYLSDISTSTRWLWLQI